MRSKNLSLILAGILSLATILPAPACSKGSKTITIGMVIDLSGASASLGLVIQNGAKLAVQQVNAAGGINGSQVNLIIEDGQTDATASFNAVKKLAEVDGCKVIIGPESSGAVLASGQYALDHQVLLISPSATSPNIAVQPWRKFFYRTVPSDELQGQVMAQLISENGYKKVAILVVNNAYGTGVANVLAENIGSNASIVATIKYEQTKLDYLSELNQIKSLAPDCVVHVGYVADADVIYKQALQIGFTGAQWISSEGLYGDQTLQVPEAAQFMASSVIGKRVVPPADWPAYTRFVADYKAAFNADPGVYCDTAYDATMLALNAIKKVGPDEATEITAEVLKLAQGYKGASGVVTLAGNGDRVSGSFEVWKVVKAGASYTYQQVKVIKL